MDLPTEPKKEEATLPQVAMNINLPAQEPKSEIVQAEQIVSMCRDIMTNIVEEGDEIKEAYVNFADMVFNSGDATAASKEALVNLLKLRSDLVDKKTRIMEMLVKAYKDVGPKSVTAHQHNDFIISDKRKLLQELDKKNDKS